jgi:hypothetical protein
MAALSTEGYMARYGLKLWKQGYAVLPLKPGTKIPDIPGWQNLEITEARVNGWRANGRAGHGVGVNTRHTPCIDMDIHDEEVVEKVAAKAQELIGATVARVGQPPKRALFYRTDKPFKKMSSPVYEDFLGQRHQLEILCDGQQAVLYAVHPDTGEPYQYVSEKSALDVAHGDLPLLTEALARELIEWFMANVPDDWRVVAPGSTRGRADGTEGLSAEERALVNYRPKPEVTEEEIQEVLDWRSSDERGHWVRIGMAFHRQYDGSPEGLARWDQWSQPSENYEADGCRPIWESFSNNPEKHRALGFDDLLKEKRAEDAAREVGNISIFTPDGKVRKQADILIDIGRLHDLFHDEDKNPYARVPIGGHNEVHAIESKSYRELLAERYLTLVGKGCNRNALGDAIVTLSSLAKFHGDEHRVWIRTAADGDAIVLDTGASDWGAIRVTQDGWHVEAGGDVRFRRAGKERALPTPSIEGDFSRLWPYLNIRAEERVLVAAFLLNALRPDMPYAPLLVSGEQGAGKSTFTRLLKAIIDPSAAPLRAPPKDNRDLLVGALNSWVLCLDNLSWLPAELSDALCRISTGGSISERTLYSNLDETSVEVMRPMILNGIEELATRPDLAQRGVHIEVLPIEHSREDQANLWKDFAYDAPAIFAGLLNGLSAALRDVNHIQMDLPRMADFALWAAAGLPALGFSADEFTAVYGKNQRDALNLGLESSTAGKALLAFMTERNGEDWTGSANELLEALEWHADGGVGGPGWPKSAKGLHGVLNRLGPALRAAGIDVERGRNMHGKTVTVRKK